MVKSKAARLVLSGQYVIDDAKDLYTAISKELTVLDGPSKRHVYYVDQEEIKAERQWMELREVAVVKGIRSVQRVQTHGITNVLLWPISCFCSGCRQEADCERAVPGGVLQDITIGGV